MACLSSCSEDDGLAGFPHLQPGARDGKPESQWRGAKNPWAGILGVLASSRGGSEQATPEAVVEEPVEEPVQEIVEAPKRKRNSGKVEEEPAVVRTPKRSRPSGLFTWDWCIGWSKWLTEKREQAKATWASFTM